MVETRDLSELLDDAIRSKTLRTRFSQDRSADELVDSARQKGYGISERDARKILAGAFLTSDSISQEVKNRVAGGLSWDFLRKVENELDGDFQLLANRDAWERAREFNQHVFEEDSN